MASRHAQRLDKLEGRSNGERGRITVFGPKMLAAAQAAGRPWVATFAIREDGDYSDAPGWVQEERRCTREEWLAHNAWRRGSVDGPGRL